jgi:hypothetical protein
MLIEPISPFPSKMPKLTSLGASLAAVFCVGAGPPPAPVERDVTLSYRAAEGCPGEGAFRERVADLYDFRDPFPRAGASWSVDIAIEPTDGGYQGTLRLLAADGTVRSRLTERHEVCDGLAYVLAHRVRLLVAPRVRAEASVRPPAGSGAAGERDLARRLDRLEEKVEAHEEKLRTQREQIKKLTRDLEELKKMNLTYTLSAGVLMTANLTSDVGPGVWVGGDLRSGPLSLGLELRGVLPARFEVGLYDQDVSQFVGLLTPCGRYSVFFGCGVAGLGTQFNHDSDFEGLAPGQSPTRTQLLVQLGGRVGVEVPLGESRFAIRGWGEVLYSTPSLTTTYAAEGYSAKRPDVSAFFGLGLVVKLGPDKQGGN